MKCESCFKHWTGKDENDECTRRRVRGGLALAVCPDYECACAIEREDDGTERCGCCGALHRGWTVCPYCGADYRPRSVRNTAEAEDRRWDELVRVVTVEITEVMEGVFARENIDGRAKPNRDFYLHELRKAFPMADNINISRIQQFITRDMRERESDGKE